MRDIGTGTYTVVGQVAPDLLGLTPAQVDVDMGDTEMPPSAQSGGPALPGAVAHALHRAVATLRASVAGLAHDDPDSPLRGAQPDDLEIIRDGVRRRGEPSAVQPWTDLLSHHGLDALSADGRVDGSDAGDGSMFEEIAVDPGTGRVANGTFADCLVPTHADVPDIDIVFVGDPDHDGAVRPPADGTRRPPMKRWGSRASRSRSPSEISDAERRSTLAVILRFNI